MHTYHSVWPPSTPTSDLKNSMKSLKFPSLPQALSAFALIGLLSGTAAFAAPITPTYSTFGTLSGATFGGTGIPNNAVAITTFNGVTLGLTATARYANPPVTSNGAGTFYALAGSDTPSAYGVWNFDFYAANNSLTDYNLQLLWDTNPGVGTDQTSLLSLGTGAFNAGAVTQNSLNLGMGFIGGSFSPTASGEYSFALILTNQAGAEVARSAINVNVGTPSSVPDAASTGLLSALGLGTLLVAARLNRRAGSRL